MEKKQNISRQLVGGGGGYIYIYPQAVVIYGLEIKTDNNNLLTYIIP